jgi:pyruvate/2-oxoglutarate dehydrogenase complex dihydrolipoamide acyltransferase (E2) component
MAIPIVQPDLGATGEEIRISCWLVELGDTVELGDRVLEVLVRGMTFDVSAPQSGIISKIGQPADASVKTGDILGWID